MTSDIAVSVVAVVVVIALLLALLLAFLAHGRHDVDGRYGQQTSIAQPEEEMLATAEMVILSQTEILQTKCKSSKTFLLQVTGITLGAVTSGGQLIPKELVHKKFFFAESTEQCALLQVTEAQKERLALTGHPNTLETKVS